MGVVCHAQPEGIGVMFWQPQPELYESVASAQQRIPEFARRAQTGTYENHP
jgi:hypothetical protein